MGSHEQHSPEGPDNHIETSSTEKNMGDKDVALGTSEVESVGWDAARTKKLLRKTDRVLLPFLALLYLLSFLDRTNIGNAKLAGLEEDLGMTGKWDYNVSRISPECGSCREGGTVEQI